MSGLFDRGLGWVRARDRGLAAFRRAGRAAIVMPGMFALGEKVFGNPQVATFAAFGAFAMVLLVDFPGPMKERLLAQATLAAAGAGLVCLGTIASRSTWLAAVAMAAVGFGVIFAGVVSSVLAGATVSLLIAFILPVTLPGPVSSIPDRLAGWGLASGAAILAVSLLWPAPAHDPLRSAAAAACRALGARLRADVAFHLGAGIAAAERDEAVTGSAAALESLGRVFFAGPFRPTGLSTSARSIVRLVDELGWLGAIVEQGAFRPEGGQIDRNLCAVKSRCASVLDRAAALLQAPDLDPAPLASELAALRVELAELEQNVTFGVPAACVAARLPAAQVVSALEPGFRAQELTFAVSQVAENVDLVARADRRSFVDRLFGRTGQGLGGTFTAATERAAGHVDQHSVWLHNSIRGAVGLAVAVAIADGSGVQHSFWIVLGTLSVLRSNALSTGQNVVRGLLGTIAGFAVGSALLWLIGSNPTVLWFLLPIAILFAGFAPSAISFAAGQAAFTLTLVILFNILQPAGWRVGLVRIEDVAIGCGVSLGVGLLLWPRGATAALSRALTDAYAESARYLAAAVAYGASRCDHGRPSRPAPDVEVARAAAAARRLDDAFRTYLAERGAKPMPLPVAVGLVTGVAGLRLAASAVLDLWEGDDGTSQGDRAAASRQLLAMGGAVEGWYVAFADALAGGGELPEPLAEEQLGEGLLVDAVVRDLTRDDGRANAVAVRVIWTGDHLDAARRLQAAIVAPARLLVEHRPAPVRTGRERLLAFAR
ncbi:MAG TPA: FUSC family protein [Gaiellaceae bacterium]|nr:FUSC family protein [Gaiellaceae bacterium]